MSSNSSSAVAAEKKAPLLGWEMSDKIKPEVNPGAVGLWTFFSPLAGIVPKDALNLGQGESSAAAISSCTESAAFLVADATGEYV